ncbi:MAG: hypothetical protein MUF33_09270 [Candidatus Nanopelagicales bacterium]|nr:hypothetical protein [Candidatus Nanopelagicales bacterium]MCU0298693.1 hypothetical protein [Candidatus Nanopelagicales bacterium]
MSTELRELLEDVAAGKITAEEASTRIHDLQKPADEPVVNDTPVARIVIKAGAVRLRVVGDPGVAQAVADGPHTVAHEGDALVITTSTTGDYTVDPPRSAFMSWVGQMVNRVGATLDVRVNPNLPIQILLVGGPLDLSGVNAGASVGVEAGSAALSGSGPLLLDVSSGSGRVDWTFTGQSRVRADMGSVNVTVRPDSDVVVTADTSLGQAVVKSHTGNLKAPQDGSTPGVTVGGGNGVLTVSSRMGAAQVTVA